MVGLSGNAFGKQNLGRTFTFYVIDFTKFSKLTCLNNDSFNSFMGSFLEFIFSNSPIYFLQILFILFFCLIKSRANCQISQQRHINSLERASKKSSKKQKVNKILKKKNWRIRIFWWFWWREQVKWLNCKNKILRESVSRSKYNCEFINTSASLWLILCKSAKLKVTRCSPYVNHK